MSLAAIIIIIIWAICSSFSINTHFINQCHWQLLSWAWTPVTCFWVLWTMFVAVRSSIRFGTFTQTNDVLFHIHIVWQKARYAFHPLEVYFFPPPWTKLNYQKPSRIPTIAKETPRILQCSGGVATHYPCLCATLCTRLHYLLVRSKVCEIWNIYITKRTSCELYGAFLGLDLDSATSFDCDSTPRQTFLGVIRVQGTLLSCQWLSQWPQSCGIRWNGSSHVCSVSELVRSST